MYFLYTIKSYIYICFNIYKYIYIYIYKYWATTQTSTQPIWCAVDRPILIQGQRQSYMEGESGEGILGPLGKVRNSWASSYWAEETCPCGNGRGWCKVYIGWRKDHMYAAQLPIARGHAIHGWIILVLFGNRIYMLSIELPFLKIMMMMMMMMMIMIMMTTMVMIATFAGGVFALSLCPHLFVFSHPPRIGSSSLHILCPPQWGVYWTWNPGPCSTCCSMELQWSLA